MTRRLRALVVAVVLAIPITALAAQAAGVLSIEEQFSKLVWFLAAGATSILGVFSLRFFNKVNGTATTATEILGALAGPVDPRDGERRGGLLDRYAATERSVNELALAVKGIPDLTTRIESALAETLLAVDATKTLQREAWRELNALRAERKKPRRGRR